MQWSIFNFFKTVPILVSSFGQSNPPLSPFSWNTCQESSYFDCKRTLYCIQHYSSTYGYYVKKHSVLKILNFWWPVYIKGYSHMMKAIEGYILQYMPPLDTIQIQCAMVAMIHLDLKVCKLKDSNLIKGSQQEKNTK